jgi:hypothetical protein
VRRRDLVEKVVDGALLKVTIWFAPAQLVTLLEVVVAPCIRTPQMSERDNNTVVGSARAGDGRTKAIHGKSSEGAHRD